MYGVSYIWHAAALKQVPSCKFFPMEAVRTNVMGTDNVLHAAIDANVERVVCLSTDKAAYPINAIGTSKAMMEHVIRANARVSAEPGDLFIQKADASTIGDLAKVVQQLFGETETRIIGTRHGEKLYECLMTREERTHSQDMENYFRVSADNRDLNHDKFFVEGQITPRSDEAYTSHNTRRLYVQGVVDKLMTTDYVREELEGRPHAIDA